MQKRKRDKKEQIIHKHTDKHGSPLFITAH